ncbi:DUF1127 domain-containing protein [Microvirga arsenatis]|uniref:DUF1127 domain-containing protein n=1 Tax=Microvirga arsenatis TaxID=2692265 RepID=A0ABW9YY47_9HYPH|nr:DUF1127 domain-containing protein [Microvirga arsenatis]NBJ10319.1 DUF1127 domain-containing protein [Microvirga arsenatis]NBJ24782.1 DUF1127 domain-containing protein [Microvirga arsenatis]
MNTLFHTSKHKSRFYWVNLIIRDVASRVMRIPASWSHFTYRRALQRLEHLNDRTLRDIGLWREPECRIDEWWRMNPPP